MRWAGALALGSATRIPGPRDVPTPAPLPSRQSPADSPHPHRFAQAAPFGSRRPQALAVFGVSGSHCRLGRTFTVFRWILVRFSNSFRIRPRSAFLEHHFHPSSPSRSTSCISRVTTIQINFLPFRTSTLIDYDAMRSAAGSTIPGFVSLSFFFLSSLSLLVEYLPRIISFAYQYAPSGLFEGQANWLISPSSSRLRACGATATYFALVRPTVCFSFDFSPSPHAPFLNVSRAYSTSSRTHSVHVIHPNRLHLSYEWCLGTWHLTSIRMHHI